MNEYNPSKKRGNLP